jgi:hypothetical protein
MKGEIKKIRFHIIRTASNDNLKCRSLLAKISGRDVEVRRNWRRTSEGGLADE